MSERDGISATVHLDARTTRRWRRRTALTAKRAVLLGLGLALMAAGVVSVPTPIPIGFVLFAMGLYFAARGSKAAGRAVKWGRRRSPWLSAAFNRMKNRLPRPMRRFIEKTDPGV